MIDVDPPKRIYSSEILERYPNNILIIKFNDITIGSISLEFNDKELWQKLIHELNGKNSKAVRR